jgi:hypothetical protein
MISRLFIEIISCDDEALFLHSLGPIYLKLRQEVSRHQYYYPKV